jgi:hypothetical protein
MISARQRSSVLSLLALTLGAGGPAIAADWQPISPGAAEPVVETADACPTFSWAATRSSGAVRIVVVDVTDGDRLAPGGAANEVVLEARLPGGARSWTPSADECLERGRAYRWFVLDAEAETVPTAGYAFEISEVPTVAAIEWAREVLRRHLGAPARPRPGNGPGVRGALAAGTEVTASLAAAHPVESAPLESSFSADATLGVLGATRATGLRAVASASSSGDIFADSRISSLAAPLQGNRIVFTDSSGSDEITVSPLSSVHTGFDLEIGGWVNAGTLEATSLVSATAVQLPFGSWTGDDGGTGVTYVDQKSCGILGFGKCIRVDENDTFCSGGSFVVAARLWQTDADQIGVQVRCTDPGLTP